MSVWTPEPEHLLRLVEQERAKDDPEPKALACYGLVRYDAPNQGKMVLRFVDGRPVSDVTCQFLAWLAQVLGREGKKALLLVWDNAGWHISRQVRAWLKAHNRQAKRQGPEGGCRILVCQLPSKSPWLNPIEPRWAHGKRQVAEPAATLNAKQLIERVHRYYGCERLPNLVCQGA